MHKYENKYWKTEYLIYYFTLMASSPILPYFLNPLFKQARIISYDFFFFPSFHTVKIDEWYRAQILP